MLDFPQVVVLMQSTGVGLELAVLGKGGNGHAGTAIKPGYALPYRFRYLRPKRQAMVIPPKALNESGRITDIQMKPVI